jgi:hypothetical protein
MGEDWREQMKRVERQRAEEQAQYELRSAEADKRWADATERWAKTEKSIQSLLAIAQLHAGKLEGWREADKRWRWADSEWREFITVWREAGKAADERLRVLLNLVERQSRGGHNHQRKQE